MARGKKEIFGFRDLTMGLVLIVNDKNLVSVKKVFENEMFDNAILACGYIDHEAGITFEVLCLAEYSSNGSLALRRGNPEVSMKLRYDSVDGTIVLLMDQPRPDLQDKIDRIQNGYKVNEHIMKARNTWDLDDFRHPQFPDDVLLYFHKKDTRPEGIWCRIESEIESRPAAVLMNEPISDFGVHKGDMISFEWGKDEDKMIGIARLPWMEEK